MMRIRSTRRAGLVLTLFMLMWYAPGSHRAVAAAEPLVQQTVVTAYLAEVGFERTSGCITTSLYVAAGRSLVTGYSYRSADRFESASLGLYEIDVCQDILIRSWGTITPVVVDLSTSSHVFRASGVVTIQECIQSTGDCSSRDVAFDLTWAIDKPASERVVDTSNDIHGSGCLSNQLAATSSADLSGSVDGDSTSSWSISYAQVGWNVSAGVCHTPTGT